MTSSDELVNFDVIEDHKENIQSLPRGRSAKKLAELFSPSPFHKVSTPTPTDARNVNDCIRAEYEAEIENITESDDPLDVFDRYVRWTLDAYPSAQATPQSQLHILLERATKAFSSSSQYKNDPRYLKLWMHYIQLFSDSPRETYVFLSRHGIGEGLALFYEEYAAWLEDAGRWAQAEQVFKLGIEREARPVQRLLRKFKEFEQRVAQQPNALAEPSSPALPTIRPALAAKMDPFGAALRPADPHSSRPNHEIDSAPSKPAKSKIAIFSDVSAEHSPLPTRDAASKGWDTIAALVDRKKENVIEPKSWVGETLRAGGKKSTGPKLPVFKDPSFSQIQNIVVVPSKHQVTVHPQTGKREYIFVDLTAVYPSPEQQGTELSFEEILVANRGWSAKSWQDDPEEQDMVPDRMALLRETDQHSNHRAEQWVLHQDPVLFDENGAVREIAKKPRGGVNVKAMELNETQIIKAKLNSPSGPKIRKKNFTEPTMTLHTKAATDDIYEIFNAPLHSNIPEAEESGVEEGDEDEYETEGDYTTDAESTGTTKLVDHSEQDVENRQSETRSVNHQLDSTVYKHIPSHLLTEDDSAQERGAIHAGITFPEDADIQLFQEDVSRLPEMNSSAPRSRTMFVPIPPEDYEPPIRPYRDPAEVANNRLPFMTPITERTESSLDVDIERAEQFKTPCKNDNNSARTAEQSDLEQLSSPLREILNDKQLSLQPKTRQTQDSKANTPLVSKIAGISTLANGPIIKELQCNPVDQRIRNVILMGIQPPLISYRGFYDNQHLKHDKSSEIRKFAKAFVKAGKGNIDKMAPVLSPVVLEFENGLAKYTLKRELGAGAFAPVYLVENSDPGRGDITYETNAFAMENGVFDVRRRSSIEALKIESPPSSWEFYMMRLAHTRLGSYHRAAASLSYPHELHLYQNEAFLFLPFHQHGTLLDVVNFFRAEPSGLMDEQLAMFFTIELLRTVEALHSEGIIHGDLKPDNCLLRLDSLSTSWSSNQTMASQWSVDGTGGWASRGIVLIDFGRGIDMRNFNPEVEFIADWKTSIQDCPEMREGRPWTWQIDYYGLAGTIHCLLFGKYIETARSDQGGLGRAGRRYKIRESLKRYWQTDIWSDCFEVLLNPASFLTYEEGGSMPVLISMRNIRKRMEAWLEANCERVPGLKPTFGRVEAFARSRK